MPSGVGKKGNTITCVSTKKELSDKTLLSYIHTVVKLNMMHVVCVITMVELGSLSTLPNNTIQSCKLVNFLDLTKTRV